MGVDGETTHISAAANGFACACTCPACGGALVARQGRVREHNFAHASGDECPHAVESALHLAAKDILAARREIVLPAVVAVLLHGREITIAPQRCWSVESVEVEQRLGPIVPDLIVRINGRELLIEVKMTHGVDADKLRKIRELGVSYVEIDLSGIERALVCDKHEKIVVDGVEYKRWLHNLRAEKERRRILYEATLLEAGYRGLALHVDGSPIPARTWKHKPYANVIDDSIACEHMITVGDPWVACDGFRAIGKPRPPQSVSPRPPLEAFEHPEEDDPMRAADRWLNE